MTLTDLHLAAIQQSLGTWGAEICKAIVEIGQKANEYDKLKEELDTLEKKCAADE
jgi:hypothetical protein